MPMSFSSCWLFHTPYWCVRSHQHTIPFRSPCFYLFQVTQPPKLTTEILKETSKQINFWIQVRIFEKSTFCQLFWEVLTFSLSWSSIIWLYTGRSVCNSPTTFHRQSSIDQRHFCSSPLVDTKIVLCISSPKQLLLYPDTALPPPALSPSTAAQ